MGNIGENTRTPIAAADVPSTQIGEAPRMTNASQDKLIESVPHKPSAFQVWGSRVLIVIVVVWTVAMIVSLRERFLDRFVVGTRIGLIGVRLFRHAERLPTI